MKARTHKKRNKINIRKQKTRNSGGAKERALTAALASIRHGAIGVADALSFGAVGAVEDTNENDAALVKLKANVKYMLVSIENCNRLLDYMYRKKIKCVKNTSVKSSRIKTQAVLVHRLVCNPQLESQLRQLMGELLQQLNGLKIVDDELVGIIDSDIIRLNSENSKRYAEVVKLTKPLPPSPSSGDEAHAIAGEGEGSPEESEHEPNTLMQEALTQRDHLINALELARILKNAHTSRESPPPPLVKLTTTTSIFSADKTKRVKITLSEYLANKLQYRKETPCETLLNEYITHYASETAQPKSKQPSTFVHRLMGWYGYELVNAKQQDPIMIFESVNAINEGNNHKELLYLFYTFLKQFDALDYSSGSNQYAQLNGDVQGEAMSAIVDMLRDPQRVTNVLQAIVRPGQVQEVIRSINRTLGIDEQSRIDKIKGRMNKGLRKVATLKDAVLARSDLVNMHAAIQSTMVNLNTVYQSLLFQVMMVVGDEPHPVCSNVPL